MYTKGFQFPRNAAWKVGGSSLSSDRLYISFRVASQLWLWLNDGAKQVDVFLFLSGHSQRTFTCDGGGG